MNISIEYKQFLDDVRGLVIKALSYDSGFVQNIIKSAPIHKGKMVRALMLFAFAKSSGKLSDMQYSKCVTFGAVIELLHLATLVHDDVIDNSSTRRGTPSVNFSHDNRKAILCGDLIFSTSFRLMCATSNSENLIQIISHACEDLVCGEIEEELLIERNDVLKTEYFEIIRKKTASLFECACKVGAIISNATMANFAQAFGLNFGLSFQIIDDTIDYFTPENESGKSQYSDLLAKKFTLPVILLMEKGNSEEKEYVSNIFSKNTQNITQDEIDGIINMMKRYEIDIQIRQISDKYIAIAEENLSNFPDSSDKTMIHKALKDFCNRKI